MIILLSIIPIVSSIPNDAKSSIDFTYPTTSSINNNTLNVNNSIYWQGHTGTDGSWLTGISTYNGSYVPYNGATGDVDLSTWAITASAFHGNADTASYADSANIATSSITAGTANFAHAIDNNNWASGDGAMSYFNWLQSSGADAPPETVDYYGYFDYGFGNKPLIIEASNIHFNWFGSSNNITWGYAGGGGTLLNTGSGGGLTTSGNVTTTQAFIGSGKYLTDLPASGTNYTNLVMTNKTNQQINGTLNVTTQIQIGTASVGTGKLKIIANGTYASFDNSRGLAVIDLDNGAGTFQYASGLDGITVNANGDQNGWGGLFFQYYSTEDVYFNDGGGSAWFDGGGNVTISQSASVNSKQPFLSLMGKAGTTTTRRGGVIEWGTQSTIINGYTFTNVQKNLVFSNAPQSSATDNGKAWINLSNGDANFNKLNVTSLNVTNNLAVAGNSTGNGFYAGMWFHMDAGVAVTMNSTPTIFNFTTASNDNGFLFHSNSTLELMNPQGAGMYQAVYVATGSGVNNHEYEMYVWANNLRENNTYGRSVGQQSNSIPLNGLGFVRINAGDNVTLRIADITSGGSTGTAYSGNINLVRVGN